MTKLSSIKIASVYGPTHQIYWCGFIPVYLDDAMFLQAAGASIYFENGSPPESLTLWADLGLTLPGEEQERVETIVENRYKESPMDIVKRLADLCREHMKRKVGV